MKRVDICQGKLRVGSFEVHMRMVKRCEWQTSKIWQQSLLSENLVCPKRAVLRREAFLIEIKIREKRN
jgi:hypothetical protein